MLDIKKWRKLRGMTAKELANKVNVAESTMSLYENGKREPDVETIRSIANILDISLDVLFKVENTPEDIDDNLKGENEEVSPSEKELITLLRSLPEDARPLGYQLIMSSLQALTQSAKKD